MFISVRKCPPMVPNLSHVNSSHALITNPSNSHFNIFLSSAPWSSRLSLPFRFLSQNVVYIFHRNMCATDPFQFEWCVLLWIGISVMEACRSPPIVTTDSVYASVRGSKVRDRLAVSKWTTRTFHMEIFNLKKLNETECKEQYRVQIHGNEPSVSTKCWEIFE
jgi:hypothetical protein